MNVKDKNLEYEGYLGIIGVTSDTEYECVIRIERIGDQKLDESDFPYTIYEGTTVPDKVFVLNEPGKTARYLDLTAKTEDMVLVYNETDKYYHYGSANGPTVYVNLGQDAPYVSMWLMLGFSGFGGTALRKTFRDEDGNILYKMDYTEVMMKYVENMDEETGMYPLTEDIKTILIEGGDAKGWWDPENPSYLFADFEAENGPINKEIAWLFLACIFE